MKPEKGFLAGLTLILIFISFLMVAPFLGYLLAALIISFTLNPLQNRLENYIGPNISSGLVIVLFVAAILMPFILGVNAVLEDTQDLVNNIDQLENLDLTEAEDFIKKYVDQDINLKGELKEGLRSFTSVAVGGVSKILNVLANMAIGAIIGIFAIFYLLRDGEKLQEWLKDITPIDQDLQDQLYSNASLMTWSVLKGHVFVAIITGLIGGLGLYLAGIPNIAFWTSIMILLCFIPIIGAFLVWAPASAYLFVIDRPLMGAFLFMYGLIIVSLSDNILRPYLVDKKADIHPAAILVGVIGGVYVFGAVGLFIGPVIFGFAKTVVEVLASDYDGA